jgi:hypothetical protein
LTENFLLFSKLVKAEFLFQTIFGCVNTESMLLVFHPGARVGASVSISKNAKATLHVILVKPFVLPVVSPCLLPKSVHLVVVIDAIVHLSV